MRVLLALPPAAAHLYPIVPLAWALQAEGHDVRIATHPALADRIVATGLTPVVLGADEDLGAAAAACREDDAMQRIADVLDLDPDDVNFTMAVRIFALSPFRLYYGSTDPASGARRMTEELVAFARSWSPDLVLWDTYFFPAAIAAQACGAAHARILMAIDHFGWLRTRFAAAWAARGGSRDDDLMARFMAPTLDAVGLEFSEELLLGQWTLDLKPEAMRLPLDIEYQALRRVPFTGADVVPSWLSEPPERPRVCLSMGVSTRSLFADKAGGFDMEGLLGLADDLGVEIVATLNAAQMASVSRVPPGVRVVEYLPLNLLLPTCSAIVHHGGGGTLAASIWHRLPQVVVPGVGSDRIENGEYVRRSGAGLVGPRFDGGEFSVDVVRDLLRRVLVEPAFTDGANALYAEMLAAPGPGRIVPLLEDRARAASAARVGS